MMAVSSLNALQTVSELGVEDRQVCETTFPDAGEYKEAIGYNDFVQRGESEMHLAFCHKYPRLRERMAELHPALDRWMVDTVYGRLRSRPGLSPKERQLCALAALAGNIVWPQFKSSIIGVSSMAAVRVTRVTPKTVLINSGYQLRMYAE